MESLLYMLMVGFSSVVSFGTCLSRLRNAAHAHEVSYVCSVGVIDRGVPKLILAFAFHFEYLNSFKNVYL